MPVRVFPQRRPCQYRLEVVAVDRHCLPVKLRYPVARNRLVVEQTATSVRAVR